MSTALRTPGLTVLLKVERIQKIAQAGTLRPIADVGGDLPSDHANAPFIVQAWNSHDRLVELLAAKLDLIDHVANGEPTQNAATIAAIVIRDELKALGVL